MNRANTRNLGPSRDCLMAMPRGQQVASTVLGGTPLVIRHALVSDVAAVMAMHARCSADSLRARYHAPMPRIPLRWMARLLLPHNGAALVAVVNDNRDDLEVVAVGQLLGLPEPGTAEVALLVEDRHQREGLGTLLLTELAALGFSRGLRSLTTWSLPGYQRIRRTAARANLAAVEGEEAGTLHIPLSGAGRAHTTSRACWGY